MLRIARLDYRHPRFAHHGEAIILPTRPIPPLTTFSSSSSSSSAASGLIARPRLPRTALPRCILRPSGLGVLIPLDEPGLAKPPTRPASDVPADPGDVGICEKDQALDVCRDEVVEGPKVGAGGGDGDDSVNKSALRFGSVCRRSSIRTLASCMSCESAIHQT